ncbi:MAG: prolipoprotein diacylglyceryl transferase [Candidatus Bruticola sp.]
MHSVLFQIGSFPIYTYGLILAVAISSGLVFAGYLAHKRGLDPFDMVDIGLLSVIVGLLGARFGYVIQHPETFSHNLFSILNFRLGGITIIGGIIFGYLALAFFCRRYKLSPWLCVDLYTAPLLWGMAVGRLGCIAQGCCPGKVCAPEVLGAMHYPLGSPLGTAPRYPSQVYELLLDLILMAFCLWFFCKKNKFQGQTFWLGVSGYSIIRFIVEFFRDSRMCGYFSLAQWVCLAMFIVAALGAYGVFGKTKLVSCEQPANKPEDNRKTPEVD